MPTERTPTKRISDSPKGRSRLVIAGGLLALVALSVAATWIASGSIRSPAEAAARTIAPAPSPILVPAETRVISSDIVTRGTGRFGSPQTLTLVPTNLKPGASYVDVLPAPGDEIGDGDIALVHSGRPVVLLRGAQPGYRDIGPGMSGSDILQFEAALQRLGFDPGIVDGIFDGATEAAVTSWYRSMGYEPIAASVAQIEAIHAVEADIGAIGRDTLAAREGIAASRADVIAAQGTLRLATSAVARADEAVASVQAEAEAAVAAAQAEAAVAAIAAEQAWILLPPEWASAEEEQAALFELESLRATAEATQATVDQVRATGNAAIAAAGSAATAAPADVEMAAASVNAAQARLALALQSADLAAAPSAQLEQDLVEAQRRAGVQVPANELIFVPEVPVRVAEVLVQRGSEVVGPLLAVTDAVVAIDATLALDQVALVRPGMAVTVSEPDLGIEAEAVVSLVASGPGTRGADGFHVFFEATVTNSATPITNLAGASVKLTLAVESSGGPVLAVPASAVTLAVDGSSQVLVDRNGTLETVAVEPGLAAAGYVEVAAIAGSLVEGDLVVIGFEQRVAAGG